MPVLAYSLPAAALIGAVGIGCASLAKDQDDPPPLACAVNVLPDGHGVRVIATARSETALTASYELVIEQSGRAGSATIRQGGEVDLSPGRTETLGEARLGAKPRDIGTRLTLKAEGTMYSCTAPTGSIEL